jgi:hypothetical protein
MEAMDNRVNATRRSEALGIWLSATEGRNAGSSACSKPVLISIYFGFSPLFLFKYCSIRLHLIEYEIDGGSNSGEALETRMGNQPVAPVESYRRQHDL